MRYQITHTTTYKYAQPVGLEPHVLRLRPRSDVTQKLLSFEMAIAPVPVGISEVIDLEGNNLIKLWFTEPTDHLQFTITSEVETIRINPFHYLLEPWANHLPIDYPASLLNQIQPYLQPVVAHTGIDPTAFQLAWEICEQSDRNPINFLGNLNQRIYQECGYITRETGDPLPAGLTWQQKLGSCRDFAVLLMECCRAVGLAVRFVSGYQEGDHDQAERYLHAWAEVYLPGAGWRGYDPTQGLAVSDRHIALAASYFPHYAAPVTGKLRTAGIQADMDYELLISTASPSTFDSTSS